MRATAAGLVRGADAAVFDCDGVLVGVSASYDRTIALTVGRLLGGLGIPARLDVDGALIEGFKATGGFNDEVDLACAAVPHVPGGGGRRDGGLRLRACRGGPRRRMTARGACQRPNGAPGAGSGQVVRHA